MAENEPLASNDAAMNQAHSFFEIPENESAPSDSTRPPPNGSKVVLVRARKGSLHVTIPATGPQPMAYFFIALGVFYLLLSLPYQFLSVDSYTSHGAFLILALTMVGAAAGMFSVAARMLNLKEVLSIEDGRFSMSRGLWGWAGTVSGESGNIELVRMGGAFGYGGAANGCILANGVKEHIFGSGLSFAERVWLLKEISAHLDVPLYGLPTVLA